MNKAFIKTTDAETAEKLKNAGFQLLSQSGNIFTFENNSTLQFTSTGDEKLVYTNKLAL